MCGRFTLILEPGDFEDEFDLGGIPDSYLPRYNIAPTQPIAMAVDGQTRRVEMYRWGLIPSWAKDTTIGVKMINARAETLAEKPSFRSAFKARRGLILASGFYEWRLAADGSGKKEPVYIHRPDGKPITFAGLWETWHTSQADEIRSATIITTHSNELISPFHERMPVILTGDARWRWLDPATPGGELVNLLAPLPAAELTYYPVSRMVNSPSAEGAGCIQPLAG
jgi:putative SOS response-associated peptidase YedK